MKHRVFILALALASTTCLGRKMGPSTPDSENNQYDDQQNTITLAIDGAQSAIDGFLEVALKDNSIKAQKALSSLIEYVSYYRSFFQAVTPPPIAILDAVEAYQPASGLMCQIFSIARLSFTKKPKNVAGATSLTKDGEHYFETILSYLKKRLKR